jgi:hypothetical protein
MKKLGVVSPKLKVLIDGSVFDEKIIDISLLSSLNIPTAFLFGLAGSYAFGYGALGSYRFVLDISIFLLPIFLVSASI